MLKTSDYITLGILILSSVLSIILLRFLVKQKKKTQLSKIFTILFGKREITKF